MSRRLVPLVVVVVGSLACRRPSPSMPDDAAAAPSASATPVVAASASASSSASAPSLPELAVPAASSQISPAAGPAPSGSASPGDRQRAVASLLSGEWKAAELPEVATPPNRHFDPELRKRLTTVTVEVPAQEDGVVLGPRADVQLGSSTSTVPIPNMARILAGLRPRLRQCYQKGLATDPSMAGKLTIVAKVAPNGEVAMADVSANSGLSPEVATCALRMVRNAQFDPPNEASTITIPVICVQQK